MNYTYTFNESTHPISGEVLTTVMRSDGALIPTDPSNSDYQRYLKWIDNPDGEEIEIMANLEKMQEENLKIQETLAAELQAEEDRQSKLLADIEQAAKEMALKINTTDTPTEQTQEGAE